MSYDPNVPSILKGTQKWFAGIITQPIDVESRISPIAPSGLPIEEEAKKYITPSKTLEAHQRIELYNQQYWWRFLTTLQETMPLLTRLFGYYDFNQKIAIPYILKYPSNDWSINFLASRLPQWVEEEYHETDRQLVLESARIDWAYNACFFAAHDPIQARLDEMMDLKVTLQPHIHLFLLGGDLFTFRSEVIKQDPDYWLKNDFPELKKEGPYPYVLFRNRKNAIVDKQISLVQFRILERLRQGGTIGEICDWIESQPELAEEASENLHVWMREWTAREWLRKDC